MSHKVMQGHKVIQGHIRSYKVIQGQLARVFGSMSESSGPPYLLRSGARASASASIAARGESHAQISFAPTQDPGTPRNSTSRNSTNENSTQRSVLLPPLPIKSVLQSGYFQDFGHGGMNQPLVVPSLPSSLVPSTLPPTYHSQPSLP